MQAKIPDIEKCLDIVAILKAKMDNNEVCPSATSFSEEWNFIEALLDIFILIDSWLVDYFPILFN